MTDLLYHYSLDKYPVLLSNYARGSRKSKYDHLRADGHGYNEHISFFLRPIPLDLPSILHHEHEFWKTGQRLYEHVVEVDELGDDLYYRLVESEEVIDLFYYKQDWSKPLSSARKSRYMDEIEEAMLKNHFKGEGLVQLKKVLSKVKLDMTEAYKRLYELHLQNPDDNLMDKYAATVPHLMAYVKDKPIRVKEVKLITLR